MFDIMMVLIQFLAPAVMVLNKVPNMRDEGDPIERMRAVALEAVEQQGGDLSGLIDLKDSVDRLKEEFDGAGDDDDDDKGKKKDGKPHANKVSKEDCLLHLTKKSEEEVEIKDNETESFAGYSGRDGVVGGGSKHWKIRLPEGAPLGTITPVEGGEGKQG